MNKLFNKYLSFPLVLFVLMLCSSCFKEYLDKKPDKAMLVPQTLDDFQALLDNTSIMNQSSFLSLHSADDMYTTDAGLTVLSPGEQNSYLWAKEIFTGGTSTDWNGPYQQVFQANVVLDGLEKLNGETEQQAWINTIRGTALFFRSMAFHNLLQLFTKPYVKATASQDLGIPMPLSSDVNGRHGRSNLESAYTRIINDLVTAETLLPSVVTVKSRPNKRAALALLARIYLDMEDYEKAEHYAKACLTLNDELINYNTLTINPASISKPFPKSIPNGNPEVIFNAVVRSGVAFAARPLTLVDSVLFNSYVANDLRKSLFFVTRTTRLNTFKGTYTGTTDLFAGLSNDELYLILAESYARRNNIEEAMNVLNKLLITRFATGKFTVLTASGEEDALKKILAERKKQLPFRGIRWRDLRRLNKDSRFALTLKRVIGGQEYFLPPNHQRYVFPIPDTEINLTAIPQNQR